MDKNKEYYDVERNLTENNWDLYSYDDEDPIHAEFEDIVDISDAIKKEMFEQIGREIARNEFYDDHLHYFKDFSDNELIDVIFSPKAIWQYHLLLKQNGIPHIGNDIETRICSIIEIQMENGPIREYLEQLFLKMTNNYFERQNPLVRRVELLLGD